MLFVGPHVPAARADPPYGMGKKGVRNGDLDGHSLDLFHLKWWVATRPHLQGYASACIWGNPAGP